MTDKKQKKTASEKIIVSANALEQRIDNFLFRNLKKIPKSRIYQMLRKGEVRINSCRVKQNYKLQVGDVVRIPPLYHTGTHKKTTPPQQLQEEIVDSIIYEDDSIIVINKPSGVVVHSGSEQSYGVIEAIRAHNKIYRELELAHRLDKETSGCLVLAKNIQSLRKLNNDFKENNIKKIYVALVVGVVDKKSIIVNVPLIRNTLSSGERIVRADENGKRAVSKFYVEESYKNTTLVRVRLLTGRTHQIRVHSAHINHPIIGDSKYGMRDINNEFRKKGLKRIFLHASEIELSSPAKCKKISIKAPLPHELIKVMRKCVN